MFKLFKIEYFLVLTPFLILPLPSTELSLEFYLTNLFLSLFFVVATDLLLAKLNLLFEKTNKKKWIYYVLFIVTATLMIGSLELIKVKQGNDGFFCLIGILTTKVIYEKLIKVNKFIPAFFFILAYSTLIILLGFVLIQQFNVLPSITYALAFAGPVATLRMFQCDQILIRRISAISLAFAPLLVLLLTWVNIFHRYYSLVLILFIPVAKIVKGFNLKGGELTEGLEKQIRLFILYLVVILLILRISL